MKFSTILAPLEGVTQQGDGYLARCPAHGDSKPSLRVALNKDGTVLIKCRAGCKTPDVIEAMGITFAQLFDVEADEAATVTVHEHSVRVTPAMTAKLAMFLGTCADGVENIGSQALDYASDRFGIDAGEFQRLGLGASLGEDHGFEYVSTSWLRVPRLVVPFRDFDGVALAAQARALEADDVRWCSLSNPSDGRGTWGKYAVFQAGTGLDTIYITEGPGDGLTIVGAGFDALAIRGASLVNNDTLLRSLVEDLQDRKVVVTGDNDKAGRDFNTTLAHALADLGLQVYILELPEGIKDVNDWRMFDKAAFSTDLQRATRLATRVLKDTCPSAGPAGPVGPGDEHPLTDLGNALRLKDLLVYVRYSPEVGFYLYQDGAWLQDRFDHVRTMAQEVGKRLRDEGLALQRAGTLNDDSDLEAQGRGMASWGLRSQSSRLIDYMLKELGALEGVAIDVDMFDSQHHLLAVTNGVIDLRTGLVQPHSPDLFISKKLDVAFDPEAKADRWEQFLVQVFPTFPDLPAYMQRLVGYGITGETSEQCFVIHHGNGANGKSIFTEALSEVFESITNTTPFSTFEDKPGGGGIPNDVAALKGARLVFASEGERGRPMAEAVIKRVTGRDRITARFMRREFFTFTPTFLLQLATNFKPSFRGQDEGLWRRVKLIPWTRYFAPDERDHYLHLALLAEAEGILAWAVRGAMDWYQNGLGDPPAVIDATKNYRDNSDTLAGFFPGVLVLERNGVVAGGDAFKAYLQWCDEEELPLKEQMTRKFFYAAMEERGITRTRQSGGQVLLGVTLVGHLADTEGDLHGIFGDKP